MQRRFLSQVQPRNEQPKRKLQWRQHEKCLVSKQEQALDLIAQNIIGFPCNLTSAGGSIVSAVASDAASVFEPGAGTFLPAPKRTAEKKAPVATTRKVFSLKTGAGPGFDSSDFLAI
jgi:hypothetical protein